jgi:hypothetical protein
MRTRNCRLISRRVCIEVESIMLNFREEFAGWAERDVFIASKGFLNQLAFFDGFACWDELTQSFDVDTFDGWTSRGLPLPEAL